MRRRIDWRRGDSAFAAAISAILLIGVMVVLAALFARPVPSTAAPAPGISDTPRPYTLARAHVDGYLHAAYLANRVLSEDELRRGALVMHGDVLVIQVSPSENGPAACWVYAGAEDAAITADSSGEDDMAVCVVRFP